MKILLIQSVRAVNAELALVLLVGILSLRISFGSHAWISIVLVVLSIAAGIVAYGRILSRVRGLDVQRSTDILKENGLNYLVVVTVLAIPALVFSQAAKLLTFSRLPYLLTREALDAVVHMATVYVLPVVFLSKEHLFAVIVGMACLFKTPGKSLPLIILVGAMYSIHTAVLLRGIAVMKEETELLRLVPLVVATSIAFSYLNYLAFAAAALLLTGRTR
jgi:hypothetical protein